ncbi:MAG: NAD-dependent epimerase/dehydratase family protein [Spirochaetia bacterium]|nr:NAD-dependent epimerase/dehydratase family protein [Spirochaetia bacterium]
MKILVTGAAGFIGFHLCRRLFDMNCEVVGLDNMNSYYDVELKNLRLSELRSQNPDFRFFRMDLGEKDALAELLENERFDVVCNLAAQAGVRYSIKNPYTYIDSNVYGFLNLLEGIAHHHKCPLVYASSSSVYGGNDVQPFSEDQKTESPVSLYAATKKANELMAHVYSDMYSLKTVGLRFFTVYGPFGRPDMAYFKFADKISAGKPIDVYNYGDMKRDFTYVDDVVAGIVRILFSDFQEKDNYRIYNIGRGKPESLMDFIGYIEAGLGKKAVLNMLPMQAGDVHETFADVSRLSADFGYSPSVDLKDGIKEFIDWYKKYTWKKQ